MTIARYVRAPLGLQTFVQRVWNWKRVDPEVLAWQTSSIFASIAMLILRIVVVAKMKPTR